MAKQWPKVLDSFSESSGSYARDVEHNINARCSIWEDSAKAKAYRAGWNEIYANLKQAALAKASKEAVEGI